MKKALLLFLCSLALSSCGRKGPLVPPEALFPAAVTDLTVEQKGERFVVSWTPPAREVGGRPLHAATGFALYRRVVLPPGEDCEECPSAYSLVRENPPGFFRGIRLVGGRLFADDTDLEQGKTYQYKVVTLLGDGTASPSSNRARHRLFPPPAPPLLQSTSSPVAVELTWSTVPTPADATLLGYNVYRSREGDEFPTRPLNAAPLGETRYEDQRVERDVVYRYAVRSAIGAAGETAESDLSNEVRTKLGEVE